MYKGNIGRYFTKTYFEKYKPTMDKDIYRVEFIGLKNHFQLLKNEVLLSEFEITESLSSDDNQFQLTTVYPGLFIGSGYAHDVKGDEDAIKLGFFFDHTTGLPCIPGSSVKGVLREAAEKANGHYLEYILTEIKDGKRKLKDKATKALAESFLTENLKKLLGGKTSAFVKSVFDGEYLPIYQRDIFFDAFPIDSGNEDGKFLSNDYITHHEHPLKNPNPVQFLKVLPQVTFRFEFLLKDRPDEMPVALKLELFRQILLDLGVGAKTNVGYGKFTEKSVLPSNSDRLQDSTSGNNPNNNHSSINNLFFKEEIPNKAKDALKRNAIFSGRISNVEGNLIQISFVVNGAMCVVYKQLDKLIGLSGLEVKINTPVSVKIGLNYTYPNNLNCQVKVI